MSATRSSLPDLDSEDNHYKQDKYPSSNSHLYLKIFNCNIINNNHMKIQSFFVLTLILITICEIWKQIFPSYHFAQNNCVIGQTQLALGWIKVIDCSICLSFSRTTFEKGTIEIRNGLPLLPQQKDKLNKYELFVNTYVQKECIEYQCSDLINSNVFQNITLLSKADLSSVGKYSKEINQIWDYSFPYENYISHHAGERSIFQSLIGRLFGHFLPQYILPAKRYYNSMIIKIRYSQPQAIKDENIQKPVVKITNNQQTSSDFGLVSILILFTLAIKLKIFTTQPSKNYFTLILGLTFINPPLFSLISFLLISRKNLINLISTLIFLVGLIYDEPYILFISIAICTLIDIILDKNVVTFENLTLFNLLIIFGMLFGVDSIVMSGPSLFWALNFEQNEIIYNKIDPNFRQVIGERIMEESEGLSG